MRQQRGFSLIELVVSMGVMLVVLGIAVRALVGAMQADEAVSLLADSNQMLQSASTMIVRDLIDTGRGVPVGGVPMPDGTATNVLRPGPTEAATAGYPSDTTLHALIPGNGLGPTIDGADTDVVTMLQIDDRFPDAELLTLNVTSSEATVELTSATVVNTTPWNRLQLGDLMLLTNSAGNAIVRITALDGSNPRRFTAAKDTDTMHFNQVDATSGSVAQISAGTGTRLRRLWMITYFIEDSGGVPYLMRQVNADTPVQVALGVTNLQLTYDVNTGSGMQMVDTPFPTYSPNQLDKAYVNVAVRSDKMFRTTKRFLRNDMTTQVSLRSLQVGVDFM